ncbi:MAG TPA: AAA family ATPase, partial [Candidatus Limnocylindrales bacterium]|nr:AAA family ATPase [Candidatus Limnocylindrales bacterium]
GKSTFARRHFAGDEILSSDAFRALVSGDAADQRATRRAFAILHRELVRRSTRGLLSIVDATSLERHARRAIVRRAVAAGLPTVAIVLDVPLHTALARNRLRPGRTVEDAVVRHQRALLDGVLARDDLAGEGHALVAVLDPVAADAAIVVRRPW